MFGLVWLLSIVGAVIVADQKRLSVGLFFFMALILGPVALIVALLVQSRQKAQGDSYVPPSSGNIRQEIAQIKNTLQALQMRINHLESKLGPEAQEPAAAEHAPAVPVQEAVVSEKPKAPEALEFVFGKYWLSRIGVVLFVLGIGLFISYSFQYFNAYMKIAVGYFFAVAFLVWGERLDVHPEKYRRLSCAVLGGAWGLFYLTTYAMHYIPATQIIANPNLELFLLWVVSVLCVKHNLKYKLWGVTVFSYFFGFMTIGIGALNFSSVIFWAILLGSLAYIAYVRQWSKLLLTGLAASYAVFAVILAPKLMPYFHYHPVDPLNFRIAFALLTTGWGIFLLTLIALKLKDKLPARELYSCILANTSIYASLGIWQISRLDVEQSLPRKVSFLIILACTHAALALFSRFVNKQKFIVLHTAMAITLASFAAFVKYPQLSMSFWWTFEIMLVFGLGLYYREKVYRMMGWVLGACVLLRFFTVDLTSYQAYRLGDWLIDHTIVVGGVLAVCFLLLGALVALRKIRELLDEEEKDFYFHSFPMAGTLVLAVLMAHESPAQWMTLHWTLLGLCLLVAGFLLKHRSFRFSALGVLALACGRIVVFDLAHVGTIYRIIAVIFLGAVLLGVSLVYSKVKESS